MKHLLNKLLQTPKELELKLTKPKETLNFKPPISIEGSWILGLTSSEVYNSILNKNTTNKKLELYTYNFDKFSFDELKDEFEEILSFPDITPSHLQH